MILTGPSIARSIDCGHITIHPFFPSQVNPNSYNFRLATKLLRISSAKPFGVEEEIEIPPEGHVLQPGRVYLGATFERIGSGKYAMTLLGRSSVGRLGLFVNITADLGHRGASSHWTLELTSVQPVRVYAGMFIGQIAFWHTCGEIQSYNGTYADDLEPVPCRDRAVMGAIDFEEVLA